MGGLPKAYMGARHVTLAPWVQYSEYNIARIKGSSTIAMMMGEANDRPLHITTPLLRSRKLSEKVGASVWLKMENVQNSGSFKARGIGLLCQKVRT